MKSAFALVWQSVKHLFKDIYFIFKNESSNAMEEEGRYDEHIH